MYGRKHTDLGWFLKPPMEVGNGSLATDFHSSSFSSRSRFCVEESKESGQCKRVGLFRKRPTNSKERSKGRMSSANQSVPFFEGARILTV
jgi:hypothetical protein